jgi:hypothetical membrane protein
MLDGIANPLTNDIALFFGFLTCFLLVGISIFDMHESGSIHNNVALCFFLFGNIESLMYTYQMRKHKDKFDPSAGDKIDFLAKYAWMTFASTLIMGLSMGLLGSGFFVGVYFEWISVYMLLNYYNFLNLENPYFSSICDPNKKLISPKKYIR